MEVELIGIKRSDTALKVESDRNKDETTNAELKKDRRKFLEEKDNLFHKQYIFFYFQNSKKFGKSHEDLGSQHT
ncbi:hypothetical protein HMPREF9141_0983 [Prevotella multiformis DSM 16608]|uniref:Uncharacterized protein n=1 Tax=Prevotella multiformis DSM 16608 TaxID=888743 RepID=F0F5W7_9BACT|nr:hypothetical protein HMPREF9141_0983 [Prevotella multiformis DSM 16608]